MTCKTPLNSLCLLLLALTFLTPSSLAAFPDPPPNDLEDSLRVQRAIEKPRLIVPLTSHVPIGFSSVQIGLSLPLKNRWTVQPVVGNIYSMNNGRSGPKFSPELFVRLYRNSIDHVTRKRIRHGVHVGFKYIRSNGDYFTCEDPNFDEFDGDLLSICPDPEHKKFIHIEPRVQLAYTAGISWDWDRFSIDVNAIAGFEYVGSIAPEEAYYILAHTSDHDLELSSHWNMLANIEVAIGIPLGK